MRKNAPLCAVVTALAFVVYSILKIVQAIKVLNSFGTYTNDIVSFTKGAIVFELIVAIFILIMGVVVIAMSLKMFDDKPLYAATGVLLGIFTLASIIDIFVAYSLLKKMLGDYASMPGASIAQLIFLFIALVLIIAGLFLNGSYMSDDKAGIVFIIACACLIICIIIAFANMDSNTAGLTIASTIFLLFGLLLAGFEYINSYGSSGYTNSSHASTGTTKSTMASFADNYDIPIEKASNTKEEDASTQLRKLKSLLDDGIITTEEYEEKRKKYVDKL